MCVASSKPYRQVGLENREEEKTRAALSLSLCAMVVHFIRKELRPCFRLKTSRPTVVVDRAQPHRAHSLLSRLCLSTVDSPRLRLSRTSGTPCAACSNDMRMNRRSRRETNDIILTEVVHNFVVTARFSDFIDDDVVSVIAAL